MASSATNPKPSERWALPAQQARSRATREKILTAAEKVFAEKGYEGARLSDIAKAAGCSVGAVYFRFKDKDALFFAIAEDFTADARGRLSQLAGGASPEEILRNFVTRTAANFRTHRGLFRAIVERGFEHAPAMAAVMSFREEAARALGNALRGAGARQRNLAQTVRVTTQMVYGFLLVGVLNPQAPTRIDDARAIAELANACIAYLRSRASDHDA